MSLPGEDFHDSGIIHLDIRYGDVNEPQEELRHHRIFSKVPPRDLKPPEGIETIFFESVHFSMQLLDSRPNGRITYKSLKTAAQEQVPIEVMPKIPDLQDCLELDVLHHASSSPSIKEPYTFSIGSSRPLPMQRKRKRTISKSTLASSATLSNQHDQSSQQVVSTPTPHVDTVAAPSPSVENLMYGALRLSIHGTLTSKSSYGLKVKANSFHIGLADVAPALWKPGYLLV